MNLYVEILSNILAKEKINIEFPNFTVSPQEIVEMQSYKMLQKIKTIIENDSLDDRNCFMKIEEIISLFENLESYRSTRHDFS